MTDAKRVMMVPSFLNNGRHVLLDRFIQSYMAWPEKDKYDLYLMLQGDGAMTWEDTSGIFTSILRSKDPLGTSVPRVMMLDEALASAEDYQAFVFVDDDLILKDVTNFDNPIKRILTEPNIGVISLSMSRSETLFSRLRLREEYKLFPATNVFGGMVTNRECAKLIVECEEYRRRNVLDIFSILLFVNGYDNYMYYGSASVHTSVAKGGLREYRKYVEDSIPFGGIYGDNPLGEPKKVTELAWDEHNSNKRSSTR